MPINRWMRFTSITLPARDLRPELMDQPGLDAAAHSRALRGLARINYFSRAAGQLWRRTERFAKPGLPLRVLDVACGGGDMAFRLWRMARRAGVTLEILGLDVSDVALQQAAALCRPAGDAIRFEKADVLGGPLPTGFDVVTSSLFLHHLTEPQVVGLLRRMSEAAGRAVVVSDLRRGRGGYLLAHVACRLLSRSRVVHYDGPQSVAAAFTPAEMAELCRRAGMADAEITAHWPARLVVAWGRP